MCLTNTVCISVLLVKVSIFAYCEYWISMCIMIRIGELYTPQPTASNLSWLLNSFRPSGLLFSWECNHQNLLDSFYSSPAPSIGPAWSCCVLRNHFNIILLFTKCEWGTFYNVKSTNREHFTKYFWMNFITWHLSIAVKQLNTMEMEVKTQI